MEGFNYLDIVVLFLIFILGLKGYLNGFVKELFTFIGIIGGIFIASRFSYDIGLMVDKSFYKFGNDTAINFAGFVVGIIGFWFGTVLVRMIIEKFLDISHLDFLNKLLGIAIGSGKIFFIFAIIVHSLSNIDIVTKNLKEFTDGSFMYPILKKSGENIIKLNLENLKQKVPLSDGVGAIEDTAKDIKDTVTKEMDKAKNQ